MCVWVYKTSGHHYAISWYAYTSLMYWSQIFISHSKLSLSWKPSSLLFIFLSPVTEWKRCHQGIGFSASSGFSPRGCSWSISDCTFCNAVYFKLFPKYEEIILPPTDDSLLHLASLIHRKILTFLEELYLGCYIVIHCHDITATETKFPWVDKWLCEIYGREGVCEMFLLLVVYQLIKQFVFKTLSNLIV
jgi:hypothetical protein